VGRPTTATYESDRLDFETSPFGNGIEGSVQVSRSVKTCVGSRAELHEVKPAISANITVASGYKPQQAERPHPPADHLMYQPPDIRVLRHLLEEAVRELARKSDETIAELHRSRHDLLLTTFHQPIVEEKDQ
jgi:hypothetical protein